MELLTSSTISWHLAFTKAPIIKTQPRCKSCLKVVLRKRYRNLPKGVKKEIPNLFQRFGKALNI